MKKEIKLDNRFGKEYAGKYVFESISWGKNNEITSACTSVNPANKKTSVDLRKLQGLTLDAVMTERPSAITKEKLLTEGKDGIPVVLGEALMAVADYVNGYGEKDREELKKLKKQWNLD